MARSIWKGRLLLREHEVPVKMYSAVEDRKVHFRLLHAKDLAPVEQHIVRKDTGKDVANEDQRKAFPVSRETAVILAPDDLAELEPPPSREIELCRFVPSSLLSDQWYDRPYYLGPDEDEENYSRWLRRWNASKSSALRAGSCARSVIWAPWVSPMAT